MRAPARARSAPSPQEEGQVTHATRKEGSTQSEQGPKPAAGKKNVPHGAAHQEHVQQHDRVDHHIPGNVIAWVMDHVGFKGSRSTWFAAQPAAETDGGQGASTATKCSMLPRPRGPGSAATPRYSVAGQPAVRLEVGAISDVTPQRQPTWPFRRSRRRVEESIMVVTPDGYAQVGALGAAPRRRTRSFESLRRPASMRGSGTAKNTRSAAAAGRTGTAAAPPTA